MKNVDEVTRLSSLGCCPFCGCESFYQHFRITGETQVSFRFDGEPSENPALYDYAKLKPMNGRVYCENCNQYLGNKDTDTLSKNVKLRLTSNSKQD